MTGVGAVDPGLAAAIRERSEAERVRDIATVARLTTDDFTLTNARGEVLDKTARIEQLRTTAPRDFVREDDQVRMYGAAALRTSLVVLEGQPLRFTTLWIEQDGQWKVAATQITPVLGLR
jgi:ketosteroid isomerase-like protein